MQVISLALIPPLRAVYQCALLYLATGLLLLASTQARASAYHIETIAGDLANPWSVAFLPDGGFLVSLRGGELLRLAADGRQQVVLTGTPETYFAGQGGYFDVVLHPDFAQDPWVYLSYAHGTSKANAPAVMRGRLRSSTLVDTEVILVASPTRDTPQHYGGRMLFLPDTTLLLTTGDGFEYREAAQDLLSELGKVLRVHDDGSIPDDNPYAGGAKASQRIWSYGHRNPQGLALAADGSIFLHEHGPRGGDELNRLGPGLNFGWPAITYGINYSGAYVSPLSALPGMEQPLHHWTPSIAPSGLAVYEGTQFPAWRGSLLLGALVNREVRRLSLGEAGELTEEVLFEELDARIRDIRVHPDGSVYVLTDGDAGALLRITATQ